MCLFGLVAANAQEREGNFDIRFEPTAILQTGTQVPFQITIKDSLGKPLIEAKVKLQIETTDGSNVVVYNAPAVDRGVYVAKPVFNVAGQWDVRVEARRNNEMSTRTIQFSVKQ